MSSRHRQPLGACVAHIFLGSWLPPRKRMVSPSSGFDAVTHMQVHEVVFGYLTPDEVLRLRCSHPRVNAIVKLYAKMQVRQAFATPWVPETYPAPCDQVSLFIGLLAKTSEDILEALLHSAVTIAFSAQVSIRSQKALVGILEHKKRVVSTKLRVLISRALTDASVTNVANAATDLRYLDVSHTDGKVTSESIVVVAKKCKELRMLVLNHTQGAIGGVGIAAIAERCKQLEILHVRDSEQSIRDDTIELVAKNCSCLLSLDVSNCFVTNRGIKAIAERCRALKCLKVRDTDERVTDESLSLIAKNCAQLEVLDITDTFEAISDASMTLVATNCRKLRWLSVCGTTRVTDASIALLAKNCPGLLSLNIQDSCVTDAALKVVAEHCLHLQELNVSQTDGYVTDD